MSKRTRYADNSKRRQPVQQQRAEAARLAIAQSKAAKRTDQQPRRRSAPPRRPAADRPAIHCAHIGGAAAHPAQWLEERQGARPQAGPWPQLAGHRRIRALIRHAAARTRAKLANPPARLASGGPPGSFRAAVFVRCWRNRLQHGYPRPQLQRRQLDLPQRPLALPLRRRGNASAARPTIDGLAAGDHGALSARVARPAASATAASTRPAGTSATSSCSRGERPRDPALRRGRLRGARLGQRPARGHARRRLHAVLRRHHRAAAARRPADGHRARRGRSRTTWPSRAASRTGSSSRTRSGTRAPPASGRPCGSSACPRPTSASSAGRRSVERLRDRLRGAHRRRRRRDDLRSSVKLRARRPPARRRHATASSPARSTAASPCPTPASTTSATSCCGAPSGRRCSTPSCACGAGGELLDEVTVYTALRSVDVLRDRFMLNGRPYLLRMVLDQGYWPDTLLTRAERRGAAARRRAGQGDGLQRRAQAPEDRGPALSVLGRPARPAGLGGDAVSAYRFTRTAIKRTIREWTEAIDRDYSHPCIIAWVPFNESLGRARPARRRRRSGTAVRGALPPDQDARPDAAGDRQRRLGERRDRHHRHPRLRRQPRAHPPALRRREVAAEQLFDRRRPGGRVLTLDGYPHRGQPIMLTEFGGIAFQATPSRRQEDLGLHRRSSDARDLRAHVRRAAGHRRPHGAVQRLLLHAVRRHLPGGQRPAVRGPHAEDPAGAHRRTVTSRSRTYIPGGGCDARAGADQAGRPAHDAVRARQPLPPGPAGAQPVRASRSTRRRAPALAPAARRVGHLRGAPPGPHLPAAAGVQPAGADDATRPIRPRCRPATGTSRCSRTASPRWAAPRRTSRRR